MNARLLLRVEEAAKLCSLGRSKMYQLVAGGIVPSVRIGTAIRVPAAALEKWVADQQGATSETVSGVDAGA